MTEDHFTCYVVDYFGTGEGRTIFLMISSHWDKGEILENFKSFLGTPHYYGGIDEFPEKVFLEKYGDYVPYKIRKMMKEKETSFFTFQQKFHFSYC